VVKHSKLVYIIGSIIIGIVAILAIFGGLILSGVIDGTTHKVVFSSGSLEKTYDGEALRCGDFTLESGELKDGHIAIPTITGEQTIVGSSQNLFSIRIEDTNGADVTDDYEITLNPGTLTVTQRPIEIAADSAEKVYDGQPLTCESFTTVSGSLVDGHEFEVSYVGEITSVGTTENQVSALIKDLDGLDVTSNYDLTYKTGTLTVTQRPITIESRNYDKIYDGTPLTGEKEGYDIKAGSLVDGHKIDLTCSGSQTIKGFSPNTISAVILGGEEDLTSNYMITYLFGTLTVNARRIEITSKDAIKEYDGIPLTQEGWDLTVGEVAPNQTLSVTCTGAITDVGETANTFLYEIKDASNQDVSENYLVETVTGTLTVTARNLYIQTPTADKIYDGTPLTATEDWYILDGYTLADGHELELTSNASVTHVFEGVVPNVLTFIVKDGEVDKTANYNIVYNLGNLSILKKLVTVTTHSATKPYDGKPLKCEDEANVVGIVDGEIYEITYTGTQTDVGESPNTYIIEVTNAQNVITTEDYEFSDELGVLKVEKVKISLLSDSAEKVYDGEELTAQNVVITLGELAEGETIVYDVSGSRIEAGESENLYTYNIFKPDGITSSNHNYEVETLYGTLLINKRAITLKSYSDEKTYDGMPLEKPEVDVSDGEIVDGEILTATAKGSITDVGNVENTISYDIVKNGNQSSNDNYNVSFDLGKLTINPRSITLQSASDEKTYDGAHLIKHEAEVVAGSLADGETVEYSFTGKQLNKGESYNNFTYEFFKADGSPCFAGNYEVKVALGILTVKPREITIKSYDKSKTYDGTELVYDPAELILGSIVDGEELDAKAISSITDVGNTINDISFTVTKQSGEDSTYNYKLTKEYGFLSITPRTITLKTESASKVYDATPLTLDDAWIVGSLADGESESITVIGSITEAGEAPNSATVVITKADGITDSTHNYIVEEKFGTLKVLKRTYRITTPNVSKTYDGTPLYGDYTQAVVNEADLVAGHKATVIATDAHQIDAGYTPNTVTAKIFDEHGDEKTDNYTLLSSNFGKLIVDTVKITVFSGSDKHVYDAQPFMVDKVWMEGSLAPQEEISMKAVGTITNVGTAENTIEVFITKADGITNSNANYTITKKPGTLEVLPRVVQIITPTITKVYDGEALYGNYEDATIGEGLVDGHHAELGPVDKSITDVGKIPNEINVIIRDSEGKNVTSNYSYKDYFGQLIITPRPLTIVTPDVEKVYDATPLYGDYTKAEIGDNLLSNHKARPLPTYAYQLIVGECANSVNVIIEDENKKDVTSNYFVDPSEFGKLIVKPRPILITTPDVEKIYDGTPLYGNPDDAIIGEGLLDIHKIEITAVDKSITNVGEIINEVNVVITNEFGDNVTSNYSYNSMFGKLKVTPRPITIATPNESKVYDGTPLFGDHTKAVVGDNLVEGHVATPLPTYVSIIDVGSIPNSVDVVIKDKNGVPVTHNYRLVSSEFGKLEIKPRPLTVTTPDVEKVYDATPLFGDHTKAI